MGLDISRWLFLTMSHVEDLRDSTADCITELATVEVDNGGNEEENGKRLGISISKGIFLHTCSGTQV